MWCLAAPDVYGCEEEQPHNVNEVPVPSCCFEPDMLLRGEVTLVQTDQANQQEDCSDQNVETVEACRHEEVRAIDAVSYTHLTLPTRLLV